MEHTPNLHAEKRPRTRKELYAWIGLGGAFAIILVTGMGAAAYGFETTYRNRIFPGVSVAGLRLDGLTRAQAQQAIQAHVNRSLQPGFQFRFGEAAFDLPATTLGVDDPDVSQDLFRFDVEKASNDAYLMGRGAGAVGDAFTRFSLLVRRANLDLVPEANTLLIERLLEGEVSKYSRTPEDARLEVTTATGTASSTELSVRVIPEKNGRAGDSREAAKTLIAQAQRLSFQPILIRTTTIIPRVTARDLESLTSQVPSFLSRASHTFVHEGKRYAVTTSTVAGWVAPSSTASGAVLSLDAERVSRGLAPFVKAYLVEPKDGSLKINAEGKMTEFAAPAEGIVVDGQKTGADLMAAWDRRAPTSTLSLKTITPKITGEDAERLGITDLLGVGRSDFSGSPANRRKNIALGKAKMNGVLIPPGENFSQLGVLGEIDGAHGWLPELVIKGNQTVPEYGGGLCQVGTTSFRAALAAGMPIVERRNHSYRVRYYEPAGTDATIYDPAPDFRFKNDTPGHLLLTSQIQGDNLLFFVWGTDDGRVTSSTKPRIYNIVAAPPTKLIPTTSLPVGVKKCTESAHAGASAAFDYAVAYADGTYKKETFTSYYKPWGAVCLIGATPEEVALSQSTVDETGVNNPN
ncbi:VanW family protein [Patescibacteria group bacterium]|jgi:vancomycin resistance protein YoaR|nr:VanW family protein [Patescibacteria group bacterium]